MLFKFKSKACADLIMLEADGRRVLKAMIGDDPIKGIVLAADLPQALARLDTAVAWVALRATFSVRKPPAFAHCAHLVLLPQEGSPP